MASAPPSGMFIPYDEHLGMHPQDAHFLDREVWDLAGHPADNRPLLLHYHPLVIYRFQVIKQADVVLALFLRGDAFTLEQKRADFEYYDPITTGDSTLSSVVQSIIAAEVGYHELALRYFYQSLFVDLADLHANTSDGVHVASTGGVWSALVYGFGGLRDYGGTYRVDPRLPEAWTSLTYRVTLHGARVRVQVEREQVTLTLETGEMARLTVRGKEVQVTPDEPVVVPLDGQGPAAARRAAGVGPRRRTTCRRHRHHRLGAPALRRPGPARGLAGDQRLVRLQALPTSTLWPRSTTTCRLATTSPFFFAQVIIQASFTPVTTGGLGCSKTTLPLQSVAAVPPW